MRLPLAVVVALTVSGCTLHLGDDGGDDDCLGPPIQELRNPQTGQCEGFGGGCGPLPLSEPDWAACYSQCDALDQVTCERTAGCRAIFVDTCPECDALFVDYAGCWATAPSGPVRGGDCYGLDAHECSRHDDCAAVHMGDQIPDGYSIADFEWCQPEPVPAPFACGDLTCAAGQYCHVIYPGVANAPVDYACDDLPPACSADLGNVCPCIAQTGECADGCTFDAAGNLTVSCYLP